jgi:hypothetical protein
MLSTLSKMKAKSLKSFFLRELLGDVVEVELDLVVGLVFVCRQLLPVVHGLLVTSLRKMGKAGLPA